jgi:hypothetical protein
MTRAGFVAIVLSSALATSTLSSNAQAWSVEGHEIVADIAEQFLEPRAANEIRKLLALDNEATLAGIANWAEQIRPQRRETARWHYVNIPLRAVAYDPSRDCQGGTCVVAKLNQFIAVLRDRSAPPRDRLEALKFVVHLAGEIHHPLRTADNGDRGGSGIILVSNGQRTNLRDFWNDGLLNRIGDPQSTALDLARSVSPAERRSWQTGSAADWANESHAIAKGFVYRYLPASGVLSAGYESAAYPIALDRLKRAGVRLAGILNHSL